MRILRARRHHQPVEYASICIESVPFGMRRWQQKQYKRLSSRDFDGVSECVRANGLLWRTRQCVGRRRARSGGAARRRRENTPACASDKLGHLRDALLVHFSFFLNFGFIAAISDRIFHESVSKKISTFSLRSTGGGEMLLLLLAAAARRIHSNALRVMDGDPARRICVLFFPSFFHDITASYIVVVRGL